MKKIIYSVLCVFLISCQAETTNNLTLPINEAPVQISSKVNTIKADPTSFFPTEEGYVWNYDVVFHPTDDPYVDYPGTASMEVDKVKKNKNDTVINLKAIDSANNQLTFPVITMSKNKIAISGVTYLGFGSEKAEDLKIDFLHLPMKAGEKWDDGLWVGETKVTEKVTIPSGTYDAWKVSVIGTYNHAYTAVGNYWITPGIGIIKSELAVPGWTFESVLASTTKKAKK